MAPETLRSLKTAAAASLLTLWACVLLMTEFTTNTSILLIAAVLVQEDKAYFTTPMRFGIDGFISLAKLAVFIAAVIAITLWVGKDATVWFMHSPFLIVPIWALLLGRLVLRSAKSVEAMPLASPKPRRVAAPAVPHRTQAARGNAR